MSVTSTVPGAISTLQGYMTAVASANPSLNIGVYLGEPVSNVKNNFMVVGSFQDWAPVAPDTYEWAAIPGASKLRSEAYSLQGCIRAYAGDADLLSRLNDAFTMLNGLHQEILNDLTGSGQLSPSGAWGKLSVTMEAFGQLDSKGYGCVLGFELSVESVQITG